MNLMVARAPPTGGVGYSELPRLGSGVVPGSVGDAPDVPEIAGRHHRRTALDASGIEPSSAPIVEEPFPAETGTDLGESVSEGPLKVPGEARAVVKAQLEG